MHGSENDTRTRIMCRIEALNAYTKIKHIYNCLYKRIGIDQEFKHCFGNLGTRTASSLLFEAIRRKEYKKYRYEKFLYNSNSYGGLS